MKKTNQCPKCQSKEIIFIPGHVGAYGVGNNIQLGITNFSAIKVNRYLCTTCGYTEEWINQEDIPKLKKKFSNE